MNRTLDQLSDGELAARAKSHDQLAYREFLRRYKAPVFRLIRSTVGNETEALDLTQETFVAAFQAIGRYDGVRPFRVWIARIALNKCRDWARRRKVRAFFASALPLESANHVASDTPAPDRSVIEADELSRVRTAIAALPVKLREAIVLCGVEEMSQQEAANVLGVTVKTVETRLYRARQRLRAVLGGSE